MFKVDRNALIRMVQDMVAVQMDLPAKHLKLVQHTNEVSDQLWPWDTDGLLDECIDADDMPQACDALMDVALEVYNKTVDFLCNTWNHAPGYVRPEGLMYNEDTEEKIQDGALAIWKAQKV